MATSDEIREYLAMRPRYTELSAIMAEHVRTSSRSDEALAETLGWKVETVHRIRNPRPAREARDPDALTATQTEVLAYLSRSWQTTADIIAAVHAATGTAKPSVNKALRSLEDRGIAETKTARKRMYGRAVTVRTHYRLVENHSQLGLGLDK